MARRLDRAAYRMNPYLLALAVGLIVLNLIFFVGTRLSPPRPLHPEAAAPLTAPR